MPPKHIAARLRAGNHSWNRMHAIHDRTSRIRPYDILLMTMARDENLRIPHFLDYYRNLGVGHFLFIDNQSEEPMADILANEGDCSLWWTDQPYETARWGVDWMNALLPRYAVGHWNLTVDLDEYFVYPFMESRSLRELVDHLDDIANPSLYSLLIDMYPRGPVEEAVLNEGQNPLEVAPLFDKTGYYTEKSEHNTMLARGGPRLRSINGGQLMGAPAMNKIPLVKWKPGYAYHLGAHDLFPTHLNHPHHRNTHSPTGALLHFKFLAMFRDKVSKAIEEGNHYNNSSEYRQYQQHLDRADTFCLDGAISNEYVDSNSLMQLNLMTAGLWA